MSGTDRQRWWSEVSSSKATWLTLDQIQQAFDAAYERGRELDYREEHPMSIKTTFDSPVQLPDPRPVAESSAELWHGLHQLEVLLDGINGSLRAEAQMAPTDRNEPALPPSVPTTLVDCVLTLYRCRDLGQRIQAVLFG